MAHEMIILMWFECVRTARLGELRHERDTEHSTFGIMVNKRFETRSCPATHFVEAPMSMINPGAAEC